MPSIISAARTPRALATAALILLVVAKGIVWALVIPPWQGPDEPAHVAYAEDVARGDGIRIQERRSSAGADRHRTATFSEHISFNTEYSGSWDDASIARRIRMSESIGTAERSARGEYTSTASTYGPAYYLVLAGVLEATSSTSFATSVLAMRLVTVAMAGAALFVQLLILRQVFDDWRAYASALLLTLLPMYTFAQSVINPDTLVTLFTSVAVLLLMNIHRHPGRLRLHVGLGAVLGLGLLTKPTVLTLLLPYVVLGAILVVQRRVSIGRAIVAGASALTTFVAVSGWWLFLQPSTSQTATVTYTPASPGFSTSSLISYLGVARDQFHERWIMTFWGDYGWVDTPLPGVVYDIATLVSAFALFGVVGWLLAGRPAPGWMLPNALALASLVAVLAFLDYSSVVSSLGGFIQGRYLFPLAASLVAFFAFGLTEPYRSRPWLPQLLFLTCLSGVTLVHALSLSLILDRYYT